MLFHTLGGFPNQYLTDLEGCCIQTVHACRNLTGLDIANVSSVLPSADAFDRSDHDGGMG